MLEARLRTYIQITRGIDVLPLKSLSKRKDVDGQALKNKWSLVDWKHISTAWRKFRSVLAIRMHTVYDFVPLSEGGDLYITCIHYL